MSASESIERLLHALGREVFHPLDLLPYQGVEEKLLSLVLNGSPQAPEAVAGSLNRVAAAIEQTPVEEARVVVFGGGTGLSNIVGGDSRNPAWPAAPFGGLKEIFPHLVSVVCVTDDGGSTGELLKDLPLPALGDLRHVLLSSIRLGQLRRQYELSEDQAHSVAALLHRIFNHRHSSLPQTPAEIVAQCGVDIDALPPFMQHSFNSLFAQLCTDPRLTPLGLRPHCLGNLLLAAAIYQHPSMNVAGESVEEAAGRASAAISGGLRFLAELMGADPQAVLPCTTTPATLKVRYDNGVIVSGEYKSAKARRRSPVERVLVEFSHPPRVPGEVVAAVDKADIIIFAPGSLYTSIIPILQVPGLSEAIRNNNRALKLLLANLWVQAGETDLVTGERERRFHVSDLLKAYSRNIPGGLDGLFQRVLVVGMRDIPGSILQSYALENKVPIYLDREEVQALGPIPLEAAIASLSRLADGQVLQHDPIAVARAVRALWTMQVDTCKRGGTGQEEGGDLPGTLSPLVLINPKGQTPDGRRREIEGRLSEQEIESPWLPVLSDILWHHRDIMVEHLRQVRGMHLISVPQWGRCQEWDKVFSFYDPNDGIVNIRADIAGSPAAPGPRFEIAFLVALGQSLLGNYAELKEKSPVVFEQEEVGYIFSLTMRGDGQRHSFFSREELHDYLLLARMRPGEQNPMRFTRLLNGDEGFTPPGLLFGLTYAWYLDNRFAPHIEYKMSITRAETSDLVPEQLRVSLRRQGLIEFFRQRVFRQE